MLHDQECSALHPGGDPPLSDSGSAGSYVLDCQNPRWLAWLASVQTSCNVTLGCGLGCGFDCGVKCYVRISVARLRSLVCADTEYYRHWWEAHAALGKRRSTIASRLLPGVWCDSEVTSRVTRGEVPALQFKVQPLSYEGASSEDCRPGIPWSDLYSDVRG